MEEATQNHLNFGPESSHHNEDNHRKGDTDPAQVQHEVQEGDCGQSDAAAGGGSDVGLLHETEKEEQILDLVGKASSPNSNHDTMTANQEEVGGDMPVLPVSVAGEQRPRATSAPPPPPLTPQAPQTPQTVSPLSSLTPSTPLTPPVEVLVPQQPERPSDLVIRAIPSMAPDLCLSSSSEGADMACCDRLSLRSDSFSLASEAAVSRRSEEDDTRSVAASSVMSLFHRVQLDPVEKEWLKSCALGNLIIQRQLLDQDPGLIFKKTALHWAAKQGRQDAVDMMLRSGADVNVRSGYTALHLASIHGHQHVVETLISTYSAKTSIRDYHGKTAQHYWSGCKDVFNKPNTLPGSKLVRGRRTQRYVLPSLLLTRSRSQGQLNLDFGPLPQSTSHDALDLYI